LNTQIRQPQQDCICTPLKRLGLRSARSFRFAPFPRLTPAQFGNPANLRFAYSGCQTVVYNRNDGRISNREITATVTAIENRAEIKLSALGIEERKVKIPVQKGVELQTEFVIDRGLSEGVIVITDCNLSGLKEGVKVKKA
jgi:hypothetical protein